MPTKTARAKKPNKAFASMTVKDVMEKRVQFARLNTKGDVIASFMIERIRGSSGCQWRTEVGRHRQ